MGAGVSNYLKLAIDFGAQANLLIPETSAQLRPVVARLRLVEAGRAAVYATRRVGVTTRRTPASETAYHSLSASFTSCRLPCHALHACGNGDPQSQRLSPLSHARTAAKAGSLGGRSESHLQCGFGAAPRLVQARSTIHRRWSVSRGYNFTGGVRLDPGRPGSCFAVRHQGPGSRLSELAGAQDLSANTAQARRQRYDALLRPRNFRLSAHLPSLGRSEIAEDGLGPLALGSCDSWTGQEHYGYQACRCLDRCCSVRARNRRPTFFSVARSRDRQRYHRLCRALKWDNDCPSKRRQEGAAGARSRATQAVPQGSRQQEPGEGATSDRTASRSHRAYPQGLLSQGFSVRRQEPRHRCAGEASDQQYGSFGIGHGRKAGQERASQGRTQPIHLGSSLGHVRSVLRLQAVGARRRGAVVRATQQQPRMFSVWPRRPAQSQQNPLSLCRLRQLRACGHEREQGHTETGRGHRLAACGGFA